MAGVTVLRDEARAAIFGAGGRGFVRFLISNETDALLLSDAPRRCADETEIGRIVSALEAAGFSCRVSDGLAYITPGLARLCALCDAQPKEMTVDWNGPLFDAQALCVRLLREAPEELDADGLHLIVKTVRLLWQPKDKALAGLAALRAAIAVRLRTGKRSGLHETGRLLCGWLMENDA